MNKHTNEDQSDFIREKIVGKKDSRETLRRLIGRPIVGGILFGLFAALIFAVFVPVFSRLISSDSGEDEVLETEAATEAETENAMPQNEEELENFVAQIVDEGTVDEELSFYDTVQAAVEALDASMVTVEAVETDVDWFEETYNRQSIQTGLLIRKSTDNYYVLTSYEDIADADSIQVEFSDGTYADAVLEGYDSIFNLSILSIERENLPQTLDESLQAVQIGGISAMTQGTPVFVVGNPSGSEGSLGIGFVSYINENYTLTDCVVSGIQSTVQINGDGCSFLLGLDGKLYGLITSDDQDMGNGYSQAYSMTDVMKYINRIYNGKTTAGIGILGQDIDSETRTANDIPQGIFVEDVERNGAAYEAGIQAGDVLAQIDGNQVTSMDEFEEVLMELEVGKEITVSVYRNSRGAYTKVDLKITPTTRQN